MMGLNDVWKQPQLSTHNVLEPAVETLYYMTCYFKRQQGPYEHDGERCCY